MALIEFLESGVLQVPRAVTAAKSDGTDQVGFIATSFEEGSLMLKDSSGEYVRLEWPKAERGRGRTAKSPTAADRRRPVPPGTYTLTGYRIVRRDDKGREWFIAATGKNIRKIDVTAGEEQRVEVKEEIGMNCRARRTDQGVHVQVGIMGEHHAGLTIYSAGKRIPIRYKITDADGHEIAAGPLEYG